MANEEWTNETPTELIPKMNEFPVSNSAYYKQLIMTEAIGGSDEGEVLTGSTDAFSPAAEREQHPTTGVLLTFEQGWYQKGLALGELRKSLSLAPGEVTKLAVVDWRRQSRSADSASRSDADAAAATTNEGTIIESVQQGMSRKTQNGFAVSAGSSTHAEGSISGGGLLVSGSASAGHNAHRGMTASSSTGSREVASVAAKNVQRNTEQLAQSTRSSRATQIVEVSENETQSTTTRVIANYNHAHAMTMQYFEVLQIYSLSTRVVRADRCIFIPMKPIDFAAIGNDLGQTNATSDTTVEHLRMSDATVELLREVLIDFGAHQLDAMVSNYHAKAPALDQQIGELAAEIAQAEAALDSFEGRFAAAESQVAQAQKRLDDFMKSAPSPGVFKGPNPAFERFRREAQPLQDVVSAARATLADLPLREAEAMDELAALNQAMKEKRIAIAEFQRLFGILAKHALFINQQMWMRIDDYQWHRKLAGKTFPHGDFEGQEIGGLIDPKPVGYFGNFVAFAWDFPADSSVTSDGTTQADAFERTFTNRGSTRTTIALPTEGVFGEAVLGQANSAEKIDLTRFWNWQDSPIPILPPSMQQVSSESRAGNIVAPSAPLDFAPAIIKLRELGIKADVSDAALTKILADNTGGGSAHLLAAAATAGITASNNASAGAGRAGQRSVDVMKNAQDFVVGLANSEVGKLAAGAIAGSATGGASTVGGLLNAASKASTVVDLTKKTTEKVKKT